MAFLLSPKTGGGAASYALVTGRPTSINGAEAQTYTQEAPGTVHPGDVLSWVSGGTADDIFYYPAMDFAAEPVKSITVPSPYTVEAVAGATVLFIDS